MTQKIIDRSYAGEVLQHIYSSNFKAFKADGEITSTGECTKRHVAFNWFEYSPALEVCERYDFV